MLYHSSPERMSKYQLLQARDQFRSAGPPAGVFVSRGGANESEESYYRVMVGSGKRFKG